MRLITSRALSIARPFMLLGGVVLLAGSLVSAAEAPSPAQIRSQFHRMLDRPRVALDAKIDSEAPGDLAVLTGSFQSEAKERVPFLIVKPSPARGRMPAIIVLHGTGGRKEGELGTCKDLARKGFLALAIDARYQGSRIPGGAHGAQEYNAAIIRAWRENDPAKQEHPLYFDTVYDLWRTIDYLQSRDDVDRDRIGMIGFSMGGIETWLTAATDERVKVAIPCIGVQSLRWSLEHEQWQGRANTVKTAHEAAAKDLGEPEVNSKVCRALWAKVLPGITDRFDCPNMLRAIAPRPLFITNGEKDPNCPIEGARLAYSTAEEAYRSAHAEDRLKMDVATGVAHAVTPEQRQMAYDWFVRWLKP